MKAIELFKQLNWDCLINNQDCIFYQNNDFIGILFDKGSKSYRFIIPKFAFNISSKVKVQIDLNVHAAINKQIEELMWLIE